MPRAAANPPPIRVQSDSLQNTDGELCFSKRFRIGRRDDAEVCINDEFVSRYHAEVVFEHDEWWLRDLGSSNGIFVGGERVQSVPIAETLSVRLGLEGPTVRLTILKPSVVMASSQFEIGQIDMTSAIGRYFEGALGDQPIGPRTMIVRAAFAQIQRRQRRRYGVVVTTLVLGLFAVGGYAWYLHQRVAERTAVALELFYSMKSLEVNIAGLEKLVTDADSSQGRDELRKVRIRRKEMEGNYDNFLNTLKVYDSRMTPQRRLILRIVRIFGESELGIPKEFMSEIEIYIAKWKSSNRLARALSNAREKGYLPIIADELLAQDLPPQFIYLALQESNFDPYASGPQTYSGIAKGMWQFIPRTAVQYGLKIGPFVELARPDPADDRHHWDRATKAAAAYLKDLYRTEAQASGFLVMSCYNWGESRVLPSVRKMPANPRDRNFWRLLAKGRDQIPKETYDYVFYIVSAAVIGEDPRLFGFDFDKPLGFLDGR